VTLAVIITPFLNIAALRNPSIAKGTTVQLIATGIYSDGTTQDLTDSASWTSAPAGIATVDPGGLLTGKAVGTATVTAMQDKVSGSTTVTVTDATLTSIVVTPATSSITNGTTVQLTATCKFSDSTQENCTNQADWISRQIVMRRLIPMAWLPERGSGPQQLPRNRTAFRAWPP